MQKLGPLNQRIMRRSEICLAAIPGFPASAQEAGRLRPNREFWLLRKPLVGS